MKCSLPLFAIALFLLTSCGGSSSSSQATLTSSESSSSEATSISSDVSSSPVETSEVSSISSSETTSEESAETILSCEVSEQESSSQSSTPAYELSAKDESRYSSQTFLNYIGNVEDVWEQYRGTGVTLAIIDSGFKVEHPEFYFADGSSKILDTSASFTYDGSKVNQVTGRANVGLGEDLDSHGTICATVAAASITGEGTVGIAPDCNLLLLKTDKKPKSINAAFKYAADQGAKVVSISIGSYNKFDSGDLTDDGSDLTTCFNDALKYAHDKGVVICSAGGNGGECARPTEYTYPGASDYVIGAGGLAKGSSSEIWSGSSYNYSSQYQFCDVFAPGEDIYAGCYFDDNGVHYDYRGNFNGTSFASPIIAGAAALYFQKYPTASNTDFERALFNTAKPFAGEKAGYGAIDIEALMNYEKPDDAEKTYYFQGASWWNKDSACTSVFAWNDAITSVNGDYPGQRMESLGDGTFKITLDSTIYDRLVFSRVSSSMEYWGAKTVDIKLDDFLTHNCYSIASCAEAWENDGKFASGSFITY